ncbi:MAG: DUF4019 domain-containing protein, partial [Chthoniobacteraceae bacterium]
LSLDRWNKHKTYLFRTRQGSIGLLQTIEIIQNSPGTKIFMQQGNGRKLLEPVAGITGMKFRYKLVQDLADKKPAPVPSKPLIQDTGDTTPKLRCLAWLDEMGSPDFRVWLPGDDSLNSRDLYREKEAMVPYPEERNDIKTKGGNSRFLSLCFSDPGIDSESFAEVTLLDAAGMPINAPGNMDSFVKIEPSRPWLSEPGLITALRYVGPTDATPPLVTVQLRYTSGTWQSGKEIPAVMTSSVPSQDGSQVTSFMPLGDGFQATDAGRDKDGKAFVEITHDASAETGTTQFGIVAFSRDSPLPLNYSTRWVKKDGTRYVFDIAPDKLRGFQARTRTIRQITIPLSLQSGTTQPKAQSAAISTPAPAIANQLVINIHADGTCIFKNKPYDLPALIDLLKQFDPNTPVILRADKNTDYQYVVNVLDACKTAGLWNLAFATREEAAVQVTPTPLPLHGDAAVLDANAEPLAAMQTWLSEIDAGNYAQSWKDSAAFFQAAITQDAWKNSLETFRKPLGALVSRKLKASQEYTKLPGVPDGKYLVAQYDTSFAAKQTAVETVTFTLEKDGKWRASGYFIK